MLLITMTPKLVLLAALLIAVVNVGAWMLAGIKSEIEGSDK
jgi:hypothetical protein